MAFDATVLSGALVKPNGINFELLIRAAEGVPFSGFTTDVAGVEFVRNALEGFGADGAARRYGPDEIEEFLETFAPLFDDDNVRASPMGRALTNNHALHDMPLGQVLYELTGRDDETLLVDLESQPTVTPGPSVKHFDPFDLHLALTALENGADILCTSNMTDYTMDNIGPVRVMSPGALAHEYGLG